MISRLRHPRVSHAHSGVLLVLLISALTVAATLGAIALLATGRLRLPDALLVAGAPWALMAAVIRPDWLLLALIAMPASLTAVVRSNAMVILVAVALMAMLLTRRRFSLGMRTGLVALMLINVAGLLFRANVGLEALAVNGGTMHLLTYYILLALLAFNLARLGELAGDSVGVALVLAVFSTTLIGLAGYGGAWFESGPGIITHTYIAPMAAAAFGTSLAWYLLARSDMSRLGSLAMSAALLSLTVLSFSRASWVAAGMTLALLVNGLRGKAYVLVLTAFLVIVVLTPTVRQEISRTESGDVVAQVRSGEITTGRWTLWGELWIRAESALPWGNGFGYVWSLSSSELFGVEGLFESGESGVVPPHNDFMYLLVEFGIPGFLLLAFFWVQLFRAHSLLSKSRNPVLRRSAWVLLGVTVSGLIFALVDDLFAVRPVAERFFPIAGALFGLAQQERDGSIE